MSVYYNTYTVIGNAILEKDIPWKTMTMAGDVAQWVEHLPSKHEAQGFYPQHPVNQVREVEPKGPELPCYTMSLKLAWAKCVSVKINKNPGVKYLLITPSPN